MIVKETQAGQSLPLISEMLLLLIGVGACGSVTPENKIILISGCYKRESYGKGRSWATVGLQLDTFSKSSLWQNHTLVPIWKWDSFLKWALPFLCTLNEYNTVTQSVSVHSLPKTPNIIGSLGTVIDKLLTKSRITAVDRDHSVAVTPRVAHFEFHEDCWAISSCSVFLARYFHIGFFFWVGVGLMFNHQELICQTRMEPDGM